MALRRREVSLAHNLREDVFGMNLQVLKFELSLHGISRYYMHNLWFNI